MKMTINEVRGYVNGLKECTNMVLPVQISYAMSVNLEKMAAELERSEKERIKICERYADKKEDGTADMEDSNGMSVYKISDSENRKRLQAEVETLMSMEVDIDIRTVDLDVFGLIETDSSNRYTALSVSQLSMLRFMITG